MLIDYKKIILFIIENFCMYQIFTATLSSHKSMYLSNKEYCLFNISWMI